ncbi:hypothetical protein GUITHDRAFT_72003 [Guillardia theta CCMP2712]|uniref:Activator of Hsp90 ATPase AHSA1-like N-terminal domain-containing protein n=1 Tax=Guillardia theta (strain CCMP2712) TaxID=905079 RepID=L1J9D3_GUITC|nr:hypothetical protein GUITHDRAFT_72003 [Guillardia theta CCMP2712]EKX44680.1 hypothetical protein GUITHDRAFT_72003 [Guillardia theta CCMP2712]|eukprot:XP_005831660.1 hypothetical protein GUITHDRAFT_72003 [Guillardia theta CCMP2712]
MAKFGEGDPRWKVQELGEGGRNVNGWHWTENDCFPFFKEEFQKSFEGCASTFSPLLSQTAGNYVLQNCTGEACVNRRKGNKVVLIYEIELAVKWESTLKNAAGEVVSTSKGTYVMPCIDTVEDLDNFEIQVKFNKEGAEFKAANDFAKTHGQKKTVTDRPQIFECFTIPPKVMAFTQSKAQVGTSVGEEIVLFDGAIVGKVLECEMNSKLVWEWRQSSWPAGVRSKCSLEFTEPGEGTCRLKLKQTGIPYSDAHGNHDMPRVVEEGWKRNFFDRIKMVFGFGAPEFS